MPTCTVFSSVKFSISKKIIEQVIFFVFKELKKNGNVSVHVVGEQKIRSLNAHYRGKDKVTDVLSFGVEDTATGKDHDWGDLFLCRSQIERQAKKFEVSFREEFLRMLIHGMLHLFGYDHEKKKDAEIMFPLQEKLLQRAKKL